MSAVWNDYRHVRGVDASVVCLGNFDGMHRGHQSIIRETFMYAKRQRIMSCLMTFDPHPAHVLNQNRNLRLILSTQEKAQLIQAMPFDITLLQQFDRPFSQMTAEAFVEQVLIQSLKAKMIMVGANFRFGFEAKGNVDLLRSYTELEIKSGDLIEREGGVVSSSRIRSTLLQGDVDIAEDLLGYPYFASGVVVHGDGRGIQLGFPTANVEVSKDLILPFGVYGGFVECLDTKEIAVAAINFGVKPTFSALKPSLEAHLLDFDGDLYGRHVRIHFKKQIRSEQRFTTVEQLVRQIGEDVNSVRSLLELKKFQHTEDCLKGLLEGL
jgi:riboflavin kinase/FMN adenylyltransferase